MTTAFYAFLDSLRAGWLRYSRRAFDAIPYIPSPNILDIGCGSGVVTVALAQWSGGTVTGIDIDETALQQLAYYIEQAGLTDQVTIMKKSMKKMDFPKESYDIIWAEGTIAVVGFKRGLKTWNRFLKPGGYMVIHDDGQDVPKKGTQIDDCGYKLIEEFFLDEQVWWDEYYGPLALRIDQFRADPSQDRVLVTKLESSQQEINGYHEHPERYCSVFFVLQQQLAIG